MGTVLGMVTVCDSDGWSRSLLEDFSLSAASNSEKDIPPGEDAGGKGNFGGAVTKSSGFGIFFCASKKREAALTCALLQQGNAPAERLG